MVSRNVRLRAAGVLLTAVMAVCAARAQELTDADIGASVVPEDRYPERHLQFPGAVVGIPDLVYSSIPGFRPLHLDLYRPDSAANTNRPLVVYIHGGGWFTGHTRQSGAFANWPGVLASLASRGYVVASVEYRLSSEARFPAAIQDVKAAIRWLRANAARFGIDKSRVLVWGASAGGQLAALAATTCGVSALEPAVQSVVAEPPRAAVPQAASAEATESDCVQAAVTWYGIFDFRTLAAQRDPNSTASPRGADSADSRYLGCEVSACPTDTVAAASPVSYVKRGDPPMLLMHGLDDRTVPVRQTQEMVEKLRAAGVPVQVQLVPGVEHSFIGKTPGQTQQASRRALAAVFEFIDTTIGRGGTK